MAQTSLGANKLLWEAKGVIVVKVLMVITHLNIGGTETCILSMAQALRKCGVQVGVATRGGPLIPVFREQRIPVHRLPNDPSSIALATALAKLVPRRYKVVQLHDSHGFMATRLIHRYCKAPVVITIHGTYYRKQAITDGARHAQKVVAVSPSVAAWTSAIGVRSSVATVPNGIDIAHFAPSRNDQPDHKLIGLPKRAQVLLHPSRFDARKHQISLKVIQASDRLARRYPSMRVILIGPGAYRDLLQKAIARVNQHLGRTVIELRRPTTDMRRYLRAADLVIATGRTAMEAMSCGKPVIACGIKGYIGTLTVNNMAQAIRSGFGDHSGVRPMRVGVLVADLEKLMRGSSTLRALGNYGRSVVKQRFAHEIVARRWLRIYRELQEAAMKKGPPVASTRGHSIDTGREVHLKQQGP